MTNFPAHQRTASWANAYDEVENEHQDAIAAALELVHHAHATEGIALVELPAGHPHGVRSIAPLPQANEVGTWSLEYLGPGFHVQLRIARRQRQARLDGWMSPAQPIKVFLTSLLRHPVVLEAQVSDTGRFEFPIAPTGVCRMSFVLPAPGRPPATPPFWI